MNPSNSPANSAFHLPPYPYDRLEEVKHIAEESFGEYVDLSVGTPVDPPPSFVPHLLATSGAERGYPASIGSLPFRKSAAGWMNERFGVEVDPTHIAATVGTKEFVASLPGYLHLLNPHRDVVLYPEVSYPTYRMGAVLSGLRHCPVPMAQSGELLFEQLPDWAIEGALLLWINYPSNPTGSTDGIEPAVKWAKEHGVLLVSDECYVEFVWSGSANSVLQYASEGVLALHSLSKRSNLAGLRVGFYAGDPDVVRFISEVRKHAGFMVPGPVQLVAAEALSEYSHVEVQRKRYFERLEILQGAFSEAGFKLQLPMGGFYLWFEGGDLGFKDGFEVARYLAETAGVIVSPGEFYGDASFQYVRVAAVAPTDLVSLVASRLRAQGH